MLIVTDLKNHFKSLPKADVHSHLHLAGSQKQFAKWYPNTNIDFPKHFDGLTGMIDFIYGTLNTVMVTDQDVINFMSIAIESAIEDNITKLEASVDVGLARFFNNSIDKVIETVKILKEKYASQIEFVPDIGVNKDLDLEKIYSDGVKCLKSEVFGGIDFYGQEANKDLKPFVRFYDMARDYGLKTKIHIGEFSDSSTIDEAIHLLRPSELQHGIRSADSKHTMDLILKHNIRLNVCPTSNVLLGASTDLYNYPIRTLYDYGVKLTVNTDDLILFDSTISQEFFKLHEANLFSLEELDRIRQNAFS